MIRLLKRVLTSRRRYWLRQEIAGAQLALAYAERRGDTRAKAHALALLHKRRHELMRAEVW